MTKAWSRAHLNYMIQYISMLPKLYPNASIKPSHHMSIHVTLQTYKVMVVFSVRVAHWPNTMPAQQS